MLLHYPRTRFGIRSLGDLSMRGCVWCCISVALVLLVCVCVFDGEFARRCFVFIGVFVDVVVMVVMIALNGGIVVPLGLGIFVVFGAVVLVLVLAIVLLR